MLSRPFYQPFNIIGSRIYLFVRDIQITLDHTRDEIFLAAGTLPLYFVDSYRGITRNMRFLLHDSRLISARTRILRHYVKAILRF